MDSASAVIVQQKMNALRDTSSAPAFTPAQKAALEVLLNNYQMGKMTAEEYKTAREKILSVGK